PETDAPSLHDALPIFERRRRQCAELSTEDVQLTQHPRPALERLDLDVACAIQLQQVCHRRRSFELRFALDRHAGRLPGDDLGDEDRKSTRLNSSHATT